MAGGFLTGTWEIQKLEGRGGGEGRGEVRRVPEAARYIPPWRNFLLGRHLQAEAPEL